jgi:KRAB domain-containing zinc finger protein
MRNPTAVPRVKICLQYQGNMLIEKSLKVHTGLSVHFLERTLSCFQCSKSFAQADELLEHIKIHTIGKSHCCAVCSKSFARLGGLRKHIRVHRGQINTPQTDEKQMNCWKISEFKPGKKKPHCCAYCSKSFAQSGGLWKHIIAHTGQKFTFLKLAGTFESSH